MSIVSIFFVCVFTFCPITVHLSQDVFEVTTQTGYTYGLVYNMFLQKKDPRILKSSFIMQDEITKKYFQGQNQEYELCYQDQVWNCSSPLDYKFSSDPSSDEIDEKNKLVRVFLTQSLLWLCLPIERSETEPDQISDFTFKLLNKFPLPSEYFHPIKIHLGK